MLSEQLKALSVEWDWLAVLAPLQICMLEQKEQGGSGTEPERETGTVGTVFPETESGTGTARTVFQEPKPEPEPSFPVKLC